MHTLQCFFISWWRFDYLENLVHFHEEARGDSKNCLGNPHVRIFRNIRMLSLINKSLTCISIIYCWEISCVISHGVHAGQVGTTQHHTGWITVLWEEIVQNYSLFFSWTLSKDPDYLIMNFKVIFESFIQMVKLKKDQTIGNFNTLCLSKAVGSS